ncbi:MAG: universal stress protein [Leucobacter sp.]
MTILLGLGPDERCEGAMTLGAVLARALGTSLLVAAVTPEPWPPDPFQGDIEYLRLQRESAQASLERAKRRIGDIAEAEYLVETAPSVAAGMVAAAEGCGADLVVLGSATSGRSGRVSLGSVAERLMQSLEVPVCIAPDGYRPPATFALSRLTVGFGRADHDSGLLASAVGWARRLGIPLRVVCFAVRPGNTEAPTIESGADDLVVAQWAVRLQEQIGETVAAAGAPPESVEIVVGTGTGWDEAIGAVPWSQTEVLAVGSTLSLARRFLLGSHAAKIVRHSPVPVLTVARR